MGLVACAPNDDVVAEPQALRVCLGSATVEGLDVSVYEGVVDWPTVAASGKGFAIARIGDGLGEDSTFDRNYAGIRSVGMIRGSYQFFRAGRDPNALADIIIRKVPPPLLPGDLPPVIDVELDDGYSAATIVANIHTLADRIHTAYGRDPIIYTGYYFWRDMVANSADFASYPLWIAAYPTSCTDTGTYCPLIPDAWSNFAMWQYCGDTRTTPGISALADFDVFQGSMAQLMAMTGPGGTITPPPPYYAATYVAQSFPDSSVGRHTLHVGETMMEYMDLRNTGTAPWDANTRLATTQPRDRASALVGPDWVAPNRLSAAVGTVMPGETYRFAFTVQGNSVGVFDEFFGVVEDGTAWFSDPGEGGPRDDLYEGIWEVLPAVDGGMGTPMVDAGPPVDLGLPPPPFDAGTPGVDGGVTPSDAGTMPGPDGGTSGEAGTSPDLGGGSPDGGIVGHRSTGGCCSVGGTSADGARAAFCVVVLGILLASRRRRGHSPTP